MSINVTLDDGIRDDILGSVTVDTDGLGLVILSVDRYDDSGAFVSSVGVSLGRTEALALIANLADNIPS